MKKLGSSALSPQAWKDIQKIKNADLLVGIPSYNNAHTINYVVYQAAMGLETYFPEMKSVIFVSDGNSTDGTLATVKAARLPFKTTVIPATYVGVSGKGSAVKAIFEAARSLQADTVALVDSDLRSITPEWIRLLISPTLKGTGFVTPFYIRHKYDGTITNFLCYPVTSSLYGKEIRQPIGGDFGLSMKLVEELLDSVLWQTTYVRRFGIDIFETHTALAKKFHVKQAFLGSKVHEAKDPSRHLAPMFRQVVGSLCTCIGSYEQAWRGIHGRQKVEITGEETSSTMPESIHVDLQNLIRTYKACFDENKRLYRSILTNDLYKEFEELKQADNVGFSFLSETWAKTVYSFIASFGRKKKFKKESLLDGLRILWIGRVAAFVSETLEVDTMKAERLIEEEARVFQTLKQYLLDTF